MRRAWFIRIGLAAGLAALLAYLYDPPWIGNTTSGPRAWEAREPGTVFRWTTGRASFFIPGTATSVVIPMRSGFPGPGNAPVTVDVFLDDRFLTTITLSDPGAWVRSELPLGRRLSRRRFRRVDLHVSRVVGDRLLGVMIAPATGW